MLMHISLSDIACSSRSVSVFGSRLEPVSCVSDWVMRVVGFDPRIGPAQPSPARPYAPLAPTPSHAPPPPLPLSFGSPAQQPLSPSSTSLSPWCPRDWRRRSPEFGPRGELPSPSLLLPPFLPPLPFPARPPLSTLRAAVPARPRPSPGAAAPAPAPAWSARPCPRRGLPGPSAAPAPSAQLPVRGLRPLRVASQLST
jgi:hypothetical protein